jgi:hypothetical protein
MRMITQQGVLRIADSPHRSKALISVKFGPENGSISVLRRAADLRIFTLVTEFENGPHSPRKRPIFPFGVSARAG